MKKMILCSRIAQCRRVRRERGLPGTKLFTNMNINTATRRIGHVSDIRNSADTQQFLNVQVQYTTAASTLQASGRTSAGVTFLCTTTNANLIKARSRSMVTTTSRSPGTPTALARSLPCELVGRRAQAP